MNNNNNRNANNNNNRRRGRSNRPQGAGPGGGGGGGGGGGQQLNRVDSRARGNAPQLLEKYRKLAQDAHLNGDRVQAEYYLQFADHYFRVLADQRQRQDEQRSRRDERYEGSPEGERDEGDDSGEFTVESDFPNFDQPPVYTRRDREDRPERPDRPERLERNERPERSDWQNRERGRADVPAPQPEAGETPKAAAGAQTVYEPVENPFVRDNRGTRGLRPRRDDRRPRDDAADDSSAPAGIDPSTLPPSIAAASAAAAPAPEQASPEATVGDSAVPVKRPRGRPRKHPLPEPVAAAQD